MILPGGLIGITVPCSQFTAVTAAATADYYLFSQISATIVESIASVAFSSAARLHRPRFLSNIRLTLASYITGARARNPLPLHDRITSVLERDIGDF